MNKIISEISSIMHMPIMHNNQIIIPGEATWAEPDFRLIKYFLWDE